MKKALLALEDGRRTATRTATVIGARRRVLTASTVVSAARRNDDEGRQQAEDGQEPTEAAHGDPS